MEWNSFFTEDFVTMTIRIVIAAILCGLVGFEREVKRHPAGFRTHLLVGVGSCIMMLLSLYGFKPYLEEFSTIRFDPARIPSYVISGIGFLGAGTILVRDKTVRGLTTAASIWVVAGLGLIIGVGMYAPAIFSTVVVLVSLNLLSKFEIKQVALDQFFKLEIVAKIESHCLNEIIIILQENGVEVYQIIVEEIDYLEEKMYKKYILKINELTKDKQPIILDKVFEIEGVKQIL